MGNGISTLFWSDLWIGNIYLKVRFPRLFLVSIEKGSYVTDMGIWVYGWVGEWSLEMDIVVEKKVVCLGRANGG